MLAKHERVLPGLGPIPRQMESISRSADAAQSLKSYKELRFFCNAKLFSLVRLERITRATADYL